MYMRAVTVRIVYLGLMVLVALVGGTLRQSAVQAAAAATATARPSIAAASLPITTLPTVHVQTRALKAVAAARPAGVVPVVIGDRQLAVDSSPSASTGGASLPSLRLDMPYYSFGKLLPRVGKE